MIDDAEIAEAIRRQTFEAAIWPHVERLRAMLSKIEPRSPGALQRLAKVIDASGNLPGWAGTEAFERVRPQWDAIHSAYHEWLRGR